MLLTCSLAQAIPPPWYIEEIKAKADLILLAKTTKIERVDNTKGVNRRIGIEPIQVLKGTIPKQEKKGDKASRIYLLFRKPPEPEGKGMIRPHIVGGVGNPRPAEAETALIFLRKHRKENHFTAAAGSFGYISLITGPEKDLARLKKRIKNWRHWCTRIKHEELRKAMYAYYEEAVAFAERHPGQEAKVPERSPQRVAHAVILQTVAPGQVRALHKLLTTRYKCPRESVVVLSAHKGLSNIASGPPTKAKFFGVLDHLAERLAPGDQLLLVFACHMQKGCLVGNRIPYRQLNDQLAKFRRGTRIAVIIEGCHSGAALPFLTRVDVAYAAATARQATWGGFLMFWVDAMGRKPEAFKAADADKDGRVSLGEAFDYASDRERLTKWYRKLPKRIWPTKMVPSPERRTRFKRMDYEMWPSPASHAGGRHLPGRE